MWTRQDFAVRIVRDILGGDFDSQTRKVFENFFVPLVASGENTAEEFLQFFVLGVDAEA